ncbi:hypothetical protein F5883DRAFT_551079 [Diaporthe sp. PMI_573]|nr:hypothetical protein F5883DRAFT_551079 [Diaporthaceae sp. PMI_573]
MLLCIVPALGSAGLLPNQIMVERIPRVSPGHGWVETATCHNELLETIKTNSASPSSPRL